MAANKRSFAEISGDDQAPEDPNAPHHTGAAPIMAPLLPLPLPSDDLESTARKMKALAALVKKGKNVAVHTGLHGNAKHIERGPVLIARQSMTDVEMMQYDAWTAGATMPHIDWAVDRRPPFTGKKAPRRDRDRAAAMDIIWDHEGATVENVAWLVENKIVLMPLVCAVVRVIRARRHLGVNGGSWRLTELEMTELEMAEIQAIDAAVAVGTENMKRAFVEFCRLKDEIECSVGKLQERADAIKATATLPT